MRVLGLDPGLATTGYGLVDGEGQHLEIVAWGALRTPASMPLAERLVSLHGQLTALLDLYHPEVAAVEELFFGPNARTAIVVGEARGVALLTLAQAGLSIAEYTPLQIKQAATGYGQADKGQVQAMVRLLLRLNETPRPDDAADALAVCVCHHATARTLSLLESQRER